MTEEIAYSPTWLDFELPEFTRIAWASEVHKRTWQPRIHRISQAWSAIEILSVADGIRPCARTVVSPQDLPSTSADLQAKGYTVTPLSRSTINGYASRSQFVAEGQDWSYSVLVSASTEVASIYTSAGDSVGGSLLGYPTCCRRFFDREWVGKGRIDTTWSMVGDRATGPEIEVSPGWSNNLLLRPLGVRPVPHLPCSFDCEPTRELAEALMRCGERHGFSQEVDWIREILSWPVQWTALHGIAEVKTPVLKFHYTTDATGERITINSTGSSMPLDTAVGEGRLFRRGSYKPRKKFSWEINDFVSMAAMRECHSVVQQAAREIDGGSGFYDLGCGDGALVSSIAALAGTKEFGGCDLSQEAIEAARERHPEGDWKQGNMFDTDPPEGSSLILMPGRFEERNGSHTTSWLQDFGDPPSVVYQYKHEGLRDLCTRVGLDPRFLRSYQRGHSVEAAVFDARRQHH